MKSMQRKKLIELRNLKDLKQKDIAKMIGISTSYYGMIEQGVRTPNLQLAQKISKIFDSNVEDIFFTQINNNMLDKQTTA